MGERANRMGSQGGAALVIGLILLAVLTLLAVAGMNSARIELLLSGNEQARQNGFQAAEAGIEQIITNAAFDTGVPTETVAGTVSGSSDTYSATLQLQRNGAVDDLSGFTIGQFGTIAFEITSTGTSRRGGNAVNVQGVVVIVPGQQSYP